ncbi:hypothetical protein AGLY_003545 [Aphis glycines]|uniref:Uncharacterized protein n=1 Tax=Aphis glycines TaxID=307491 RepID=A0A6G0U0Z7_APHGL|nr:hypothetical protein AGLY_003545 [Aphis glycines]
MSDYAVFFPVFDDLSKCRTSGEISEIPKNFNIFGDTVSVNKNRKFIFIIFRAFDRKSESSFLTVSNFKPNAQVPMTSVDSSLHATIWSWVSFSLPDVNPGLSFCLIVFHLDPSRKNNPLAIIFNAGSLWKPRSGKYEKSLINILLISSGSLIIRNGVFIGQLMFDQSQHLHRVAYKRPRSVMGYIQLLPLVVRVGRIIVKKRRDGHDCTDNGRVEQKTDQTRNHGDRF